MLLSNATVLSLDGTVLTLRFARDGDVKGFTTSGCDADLKRVLSSRFGLNVTVKAVSANDPAAAREGRPRLNPVPAPADPESPAGDWPGARATGDRQDPGGWGGPATQPHSGDSGGRSPGSGGAAPQASAPPRASAATPASAPPARPASRTAPAGSAPAAGPAGPPPAPAAPAPAAPAAPRRSATPGPAASGAFEIPDEDDLASPGQAEISGMDLIQRELGGQIIGEIDD
jgi:DNA polymerase-3 subunit gamma/tau